MTSLNTAFVLAIMLVTVNIMLFTGGYITSTEVPTISKVLSGMSISDTNTTAFQDDMVVKGISRDAVADPTSESFAVTVLDFIETIPFLGPIVSLFRVIYELIVFGAFGAVMIMGKMMLPSQVMLPIGVVFFLIFSLGLYEFMRQFLQAKGGA